MARVGGSGEEAGGAAVLDEVLEHAGIWDTVESLHDDPMDAESGNFGEPLLAGSPWADVTGLSPDVD